MVVTSRDGTSAYEPEKQMDAQVLQIFSDDKMTKLITTGGPTALCYQLYTQGGVATWKQAAVPENGYSSILLMPVKRMRHPDRVDWMGQGWQGSTWPPAAGAAAKQTGVTEVVLKGVTKEAGKGTTALWRMKQRVEDIMAGLRETLCEACKNKCRGQERQEERSMRAPSSDREQPGPQPNKESPAGARRRSRRWW